ncbi:MAG: aminotransferase [Rhizomicrobium sp.]
MTLRNHDIAELRRLDVAHHLPAQQNHHAIHSLGGSRVITHADGCHIYDGEGRAIFDAMAGLWCVQVGYGRRELARAASEQMLELPYYNTFFQTVAPPTVLLASKVASLLGGDLSHVFFNNSGSEAIDTVIRLARYYWQIKGEPERNVLIARENGYHGSTIAGVSLGGMPSMHKQGGPWLGGIEHVMQPYYFENGVGEEQLAFGARAAAALEERILAIGPHRVAAFVAEPVQGAGGVIIPPSNYWPLVEAICRKYGVLLVCDEVICGFGRLGRWFGFQHFGIKPDMVPMAKGLSSGYLPISAVGVSNEIVETLRSVDAPFMHGYTYSGHPTAAAVALRNIQILEDEGLIRRTAEDTGPYLAGRLATLSDHPLVGEARSLGLIGAIEIVADKNTNRRFGRKTGQAGAIVRDRCIENGLMVRAIKDTLVLSPPLIVRHDEIDWIVSIISRSLDESRPALHALE